MSDPRSGARPEPGYSGPQGDPTVKTPLPGILLASLLALALASVPAT
ncbi:MAG TPA: hypothetical protein PKC56_14205 [Rhodocyclaceae bacterium]|nr:hypothetical protein [Rhodocyclaceae bacterium]